MIKIIITIVPKKSIACYLPSTMSLTHNMAAKNFWYTMVTLICYCGGSQIYYIYIMGWCYYKLRILYLFDQTLWLLYISVQLLFEGMQHLFHPKYNQNI